MGVREEAIGERGGRDRGTEEEVVEEGIDRSLKEVDVYLFLFLSLTLLSPFRF